MHDQNTVCGQSVHLTVPHLPLGGFFLHQKESFNASVPARNKLLQAELITGRAAHPQEDVLGGVEAGSVDVCRVRRVSLADDAAGEARDGALSKLTVSGALPAGHRVRHHKVDGRLSGTPNLEIHRDDELMSSSLCAFLLHLQPYGVLQART